MKYSNRLLCSVLIATSFIFPGAPAKAAETSQTHAISTSAVNQQEQSSNNVATMPPMQAARLAKTTGSAKTTSCAQVRKIAKPKWFNSAQWNIQCVKADPKKMSVVYYPSERRININTNMPQSAVLSSLQWAFSDISVAYRNSPAKDCRGSSSH